MHSQFILKLNPRLKTSYAQKALGRMLKPAWRPDWAGHLSHNSRRHWQLSGLPRTSPSSGGRARAGPVSCWGRTCPRGPVRPESGRRRGLPRDCGRRPTAPTDWAAAEPEPEPPRSRPEPAAAAADPAAALHTHRRASEAGQMCRMWSKSGRSDTPGTNTCCLTVLVRMYTKSHTTVIRTAFESRFLFPQH